MQIKSCFENKEKIPKKYSCDGEDINPELEIIDIPSETKSHALILDDPDAPARVFTHWVLWQIPVNGNNVKIKENDSLGIKGMNDAGKLGYIGLCPPSGIHRYYFKVFALNIEIELEEGSIREDLEDEMLGHIIDSAQLVGVYSRDSS